MSVHDQSQGTQQGEVSYTGGGFLLSRMEGCDAGGPRHKPLLIPGCMASIPWLTSWYKMAAAASAITSAFPPADQMEKEGKIRHSSL